MPVTLSQAEKIVTAGPCQVKDAEVALCTSHDLDRGSALILRR